MELTAEQAKFVPDSPARRMASRLDLELLEMGVAEVREWNYRGFVADPFFRLYFVENGRTELLFADNAFQLEPGNLYLLPANVPFRYVPKEFLRHRWLHFCSSTLERTPYFQRPRGVPADDAKARMVELYAWADSPENLESVMRMDIIVRQLLVPLLAAAPEDGGQFERLDAFSQVIDHIDRHLDQELSIPELAALVRMGRNEFSAAFRHAFGTPPKQYLTQRRVGRAKVLLLRTKLRVKEVAAAVGYDNEFFFYRIFKKYAEVTPDEYRRGRNPCL